MYSKTGDIAKWTREIVGKNFEKNTFTGKLKTFDEAER